MITTRLYLYDSDKEYILVTEDGVTRRVDNGYRGQDLSAYVLSGGQNTENLTEELDVTELTLQGYPIRDEFAPETKFIVDVYEGDTLMYTYHRIVQEDVVDQPILSKDDYFTHTITLIEPSAIAQKRIVDNMAVTYKLKDVNLETRTALDIRQTAKTAIINTAPDTPPRGFQCYYDVSTRFGIEWSRTLNDSFGKYFKWKKPDNTDTILMKFRAKTIIGTLSQATNPTEQDLEAFVFSETGRQLADGDLVIFHNTSTNKYYKYFFFGEYDGNNVWHSYETSSSDTDDYVKTDKYYCNINAIKEVNGKHKVKFEIPVPYIMWGNQDAQAYYGQRRPPAFLGYQEIGIASLDWRIREIDSAGKRTKLVSGDFISNSNLGALKISYGSLNVPQTYFPWGFLENFDIQYQDGYDINKFSYEYLLEKMHCERGKGSTSSTDYWAEDLYFSKYTDSVNGVDLSGVIETDEIDIRIGYNYSVYVSVKNLQVSSVPLKDGNYTSEHRRSIKPHTEPNIYSFYYGKNKTGYDPYAKDVNVIALPYGNTDPTCSFFVYSSSDIRALLSSGMEYSALGLVTRAIAGTETFYKETGISASDLKNNKFPFYISEDAEGMLVGELTLLQTRINEAFYHQKNLWEVLLEAGKYTHSIPQITFGRDDRLAISFYKLGGTNQLTSGNTRISVMNFRKIDDYLSACSSYVDNLVQLGGRMVETVAPKSSSEDYLVDNETAEIIVSKPILELLSVTAIATKDITDLYYEGTNYPILKGEERDITEYIYEESVYNILSVQYNEIPNKGIAIYYKLGENKIVGGDYQLPQEYTTPYSDFSFKKILFSAFNGGYSVLYQGSSGPWVNLKVNDFIFRVEYRTKDTARVEHTRPDLRHYLLTSKYDKVPSHKQFNNQQDILVDSVAFGGSMFGKLIRTGNSNYKMREWCANIGDIKHKGELYNIDGQWYYVGKVTNIFFPEHIESIVEYSKDYNQLSEIIGIPSEPRFYEISERSSIDREVAINDYFLVTTDENKIDTDAGLIRDISHTASLIFKNGGSFLRWANTRFHGDPDMDSTEQPTYGISDFEKVVLSPLNAYSIGNTLTYEWDMQDNFSAGDEVSEETQPTGTGATANNAYRTMRAVQYCDQYGKSTLFDFYLFGDLQLKPEQVRALPNSPVGTEMNVYFDGKKTPYGRDWLYANTSSQNPISPQNAQVYKVIGYKPNTIDAVRTFSQYPDSTDLDLALWIETGRQPQEGDTLLIYIVQNNTPIESLWYKREAGGTYTYETLWDSTINEWDDWNFFVSWFNEDDAYSAIVYYDQEREYIVSNKAVGKSLILLKDCRETLHFNYNLMQITDSDTFVLSPFFFTEGQKDEHGNMQGAKISILMEEVNKMSNGYISTNAILYENTNPLITATGKMITVDMSWINSLSDDIKAAAKSIVIMEKGQLLGSSQQFIIAKNGEITGNNWYFGAPNKNNLFTRRQ